MSRTSFVVREVIYENKHLSMPTNYIRGTLREIGEWAGLNHIRSLGQAVDKQRG